MSSSLISIEELLLDTAAPPTRLLDVRWRLNAPEGRPEYLAGHLPGAVYADLERDLTHPGLRGEAGRHPLPDHATVAAAAVRWGLRRGDAVVVYDDNDSVAAARAWWVLRRFGVNVRVLDGGFRAWVAAGGRLEPSDRAVARGERIITVAETAQDASIDDAARAPSRGVLVDVRAPQHYRGQASGADPAVGHIPGAINIPTVTHIDPSGRLRSPAEIAATLSSWGITSGTDVVLYCSSGNASAHSALAFEQAGVRARVFTGGWSEWSRSAGRPVAVGAAASGAIGVV